MYDVMMFRINIESSRRKMNAEENDSNKRQVQRLNRKQILPSLDKNPAQHQRRQLRVHSGNRGLNLPVIYGL